MEKPLQDKVAQFSPVFKEVSEGERLKLISKKCCEYKYTGQVSLSGNMKRELWFRSRLLGEMLEPFLLRFFWDENKYPRTFAQPWEDANKQKKVNYWGEMEKTIRHWHLNLVFEGMAHMTNYKNYISTLGPGWSETGARGEEKSSKITLTNLKIN